MKDSPCESLSRQTLKNLFEYKPYNNLKETLKKKLHPKWGLKLAKDGWWSKW